MPAEEALVLLSIKPQSLYAYVSRGRIRAIADPVDSRKSLYSRHDVRALSQKKRRPRARAEIAAGTIAWGEPVLESSISTVRDGELYFGEALARDLAETLSLEQVAAHHWNVVPLSDGPASTMTIPDHADTKARGYAFLADAAASGTATLGRTSGVLAGRDAAALLSGFTDAMIGTRHAGPIHKRLQAAWRLSDSGADGVRRSLVLISDHELNPSSFAVRVAASTGTPLAAAALAGYATLNGPRHGDATSRSQSFLRSALAQDDLTSLINQSAEFGGYAMGFGHTLYPDGDPRAAALLQALDLGSELARVLEDATDILGQRPNIDAALGALAITLDLPEDAPFCLFAIGRLAGWLAHAIEQVSSGRLIRPRARFVPRGIGLSARSDPH
ncbi:MAG: citrate synthase [Henriciella sp.]|nr:citrate synthase [Henriciella sp.]